MLARGVVDWASARAELLARSVLDPGPRLVDTTMLYAPKSGGVKRYLTAKRAWFAKARPHIRHTLVVPGPRHAYDGNGRLSIYAAPLPFGDGYRWPVGKTAWMKRLMRQRPTLIEAGDPYTPGLAALKAGEALGVPVIGFCHTDLGALAALHIGEWAEKPVRRHWGEIYRRFDRAVAPSRFIAERLADAGVDDPIALPLGVDVETFRPDGADPAGLRRRLGLSPQPPAAGVRRPPGAREAGRRAGRGGRAARRALRAAAGRRPRHDAVAGPGDRAALRERPGAARRADGQLRRLRPRQRQ